MILASFIIGYVAGSVVMAVVFYAGFKERETINFRPTKGFKTDDDDFGV